MHAQIIVWIVSALLWIEALSSTSTSHGRSCPASVPRKNLKQCLSVVSVCANYLVDSHGEQDR